MVVVDADDCWRAVASVANEDVDVGATRTNRFDVVEPCIVPVVEGTSFSGNHHLTGSKLSPKKVVISSGYSHKNTPFSSIKKAIAHKTNKKERPEKQKHV
jgi:hypothetical protein